MPSSSSTFSFPSTLMPRDRRARWAVALGGGGMGLMTVLGLAAGLTKLLAIGWTAFLVMMAGAKLGRRAERQVVGAPAQRLRRLAWAYGLSSGAMVTSTALFLVPNAVSRDASLGGLGIALGIIGGFTVHTILHRGKPGTDDSASPVVWVLSMHSLGAGLVIGAVYATMPALGALLGLAIVSHKGPAGYAAARRLQRRGASVSLLLWPAAAVCVAAVPVGLVDPPTSDVFHAVVFGAATGLFLHVAVDFLPRCGWGSELRRAANLPSDLRSAPMYEGLGNVRYHAVWSTLAGSLLVAGAWGLL
ncbi:hypothetical protein [Salinibacter altiplanensis]|uniref:hypothetical protein n=1 Tax=Salinibacter altiplanensis TaxID=1803181 RepID=UPI001F34F30A|nr:hypothetical protein [Salinibacter altiplanensis]